MPRKKRDQLPASSHLPSERSEQLGRRIAIAIESRNWDRCQDIIRQARGETSVEPVDPLDLMVAELDVPARVVELLESHGILRVSQLQHVSCCELASWKNAGPATLRDIRIALRDAGVP